MDTKDTKVKPQETPRDARFNPAGQVKTVNASITSTQTGSLAMVLVPLEEDCKMACDVYGLLSKKYQAAKSDPKQWYHSAINWKIGTVRDTFLGSDVRMINMLCIKKDGVCDDKALASCFKGVFELAKNERGSLHVSSAVISQLPQITSHLEEAKNRGLNVFIYVGDTPKESVKGDAQ